MLGLQAKLCKIFACMTLAGAVFSGLGAGAQEERRPGTLSFDHVYLIVLENHGFDDALYGPSPFLLHLSQTQGLATYYFGVTHPSLPNYIAMISGDYFGIQDDAPSCFASDLWIAEKCHRLNQENLADQLESKQLTWAAYLENLPAVGSLQSRQPANGSSPLYAQKHNPFVYFESIATNPARLRNIKPFDAFADDLAHGAANFSLIVPNQCDDGHGLPICADPSALVRAYDAFTATVVKQIKKSPSWTDRSVIIIVFDEGESPRGMRGSPTNIDCCNGTDPEAGGNHIPLIIVTKSGPAKTSGVPTNHYSLLATIEDGFELSRLGHAAHAATLADLMAR
jgi:phosphatidylinositol-3-phosphatase